MRTALWRVANVAGIVAGCVGAVAARQTPRYLAATQGVLVDAAVTRGGHPVSGLTAADFEVRDNDVVQHVEVLNTADAPINTVLALDTSASTAGQRLADLTAGSRALLDGLRDGDHAALTTFDRRVRPAVPLTTDLTRVRMALVDLLPTGETALLDGVYTALVSTQTAIGATLVVVYTDGADTVSWLEPDEVRDAATRSNAVVDAVVTRSGHQFSDLKDLVDSTGGQVVSIESTTRLGAEFARILREFRSRYLLTFVPQGVAAGGFHRLQVRARPSGLTVHARAGYFSSAKDLEAAK
jgi:Ca-activated chloride channel family protein